jgi:AraC-like DNA-binding protein
MLAESIDAASASFQVGYESPSQFSREYSRLYGAPPVKDIMALRQQAIINPKGDLRENGHRVID